MAEHAQDTVDHITRQWHETRPDLDVSPMEIIGRVSRLSRLADRRLADNFGRFDIENWMYDVLATLRRSGAPFQLSAGDLVRQTMVTTGAMTNRIDRLEQRGLVERSTATDRRKVIVALTRDGLDLVDRVAPEHLATEAEMLAVLSADEQVQLTTLLRAVLLHLGDHQAGTTEAEIPKT